MHNLLIPKRYWEKHNFCTYLDNILLSLLKYADKKQLSTEKITFKSTEEGKRFNEDNGNDIYERMKNTGHIDVICRVMYKHIYFSLIRDIYSFVSTSLECAGKMNSTVAYSLLRKPFKDDLLFLELLYNRGYEFVSEFIEGSIEDYEYVNMTAEKRKSLIKGCFAEKISGFNSDFLYEVRYDRKKAYSLEGLWNKANHLITTRPEYRTEDGNLNFIFSDSQARLDQTNYYYIILPSLLFYTTRLSALIFEKYIQPNKISEFINSSLWVIKFVDITHKKNKQRAVRRLLNIIPFVCPVCYKLIPLKNDYELGYSVTKLWEFKCPKCGNITKLDQYLTYDKAIKKDKE